MEPAIQRLEFCYRNGVAGYFMEAAYPEVPDRYRCMPKRSGSHYEMQVAIKNGERPRCYFDAARRRVSFAVVGCPEYGVLELAEFEAEDLA